MWLSINHGQSMLVHDWLTAAARRRPDAVALVEGPHQTTYRELDDLTNRFATGLAGLGVSAGDRVAIALENGLPMVAAYLGTMKAAAIAVPLPGGHRSDRLVASTKDCSARVAVVDEGAAQLLSNHLGSDCRLVVLSSTAAALADDLGRQLQYISVGQLPTSVGDRELAAIVYTSGSTGTPRGVMLSHRNFIANADAIVDYLQLTFADRVMCILPFHYVYGLSLLHTHLAVGGAVVIENRSAFPNVVLESMARHEVTGFAGVPSTFALMLQRSIVAGAQLPHLRYVTQAGGPMPPARIQEWLARGLKADFYVMYGATEAAARLTYLPPADLMTKMGSVGRPVANVRISVVDERGELLPAGATGELVASGENISSGYWNDPVETARRFTGRGYHTGDFGYIDEEGYIFLIGRRDDMIKVGGHRVGASEIERVLSEHPAVQEVCVVSQAHNLLGEVPVAIVVPRWGQRLDEPALRAFCDQRLTAYKVPARVHIWDELPKLPHVGKVDKREVRARLGVPQ